MASYHSTTILGNLGRDPETRFLPSGEAVCNFSVAVTEKWKKDGEQKEQTTWYRVNAFGKLAEICGQYLAKGSAVLVVGKMQARKWTDKEGNERESWELRADSMQMVGGKPEGERQDKPARQAAPAGGGGGNGNPNLDDMDDDIPFTTCACDFDAEGMKPRRYA